MSTKSEHQVMKLNQALKNLDSLVGRWKMAGSHPMLPAPVYGKASFEWIEEGAFLAWRTDFEQGGPPSAIAVIGRDESLSAYSILYFDVRGVSRIYEMSLENDEWTFWRNSPGFSQRMTFTISHDGNTLTGHGEKTTDGKIWEGDLDVMYTRIAQE